MSPLTIFVLVLILVWGSIALLLRNETRRAGGLKAWLMDLPTTNFRIFVSIVLAVFYVVITMLLTVIAAMTPKNDIMVPDVVLDTVGLFLIGMMGIDAASYIAKRLTHKPSGGDNDAPPGSTGTMAVPGSTTVKTTGGTTVQVNPPIPEQPSGQ